MTETPRGWGVTPSTGIPDRLRQPERRDRKNNGDDQQCRGGWLATRNHDVLAIDMDPQADMTKGLGLWSRRRQRSFKPEERTPQHISHR